VHVLADRAPLFVRLSDGAIRNGYTVKILNMQRQEKIYRLTLTGLSGATFSIMGVTDGEATEARLPVKGDTVGTFRVFVRVRPEEIKSRATDITFVATDSADGRAYRRSNVFNGP
ncbi:MAG: cytochrome c oxidase accessory protein CcoG, partial [Alphaproteobacteria bacterium]|nr:cytochrome c oxidase accessory protein CcoG [Alphaproteobacteria bacterium]